MPVWSFPMHDLRSKALSAALAVLAVTFAHAAHADQRDTITVQLDNAKVIKMPPRASTIVIGNPSIADVTLLRGSGTMVVTGRGYGETNMIALDKQGEPVAESQIRVRGSDAVLLVQRGLERESYSCTPACLPTVQLGDTKQFAETTQQIQTRNGLVQPQQR
jgi:Flp pilus assembly secretin CpaC